MTPSTRPVFTPASRPVGRRTGPFETFAPNSLQIFGRRRFFNPFFFGDGCFSGFFPGFCGFNPAFGFGFGFDPGFFGSWGWDDDGFGAIQNFGYPYQPSMSADIEARVDNQPQYDEAAPYGYRNEYVLPDLGSGSAGPAPAADAPFVMLYLNDGTVYALTNYWVAGGRLHYVTQYGGENSVGMDQVDMQRTVDVNAHRGVPITLRPHDIYTPSPAAPAPPDSPAPAPPQR